MQHAPAADTAEKRGVGEAEGGDMRDKTERTRVLASCPFHGMRARHGVKGGVVENTHICESAPNARRTQLNKPEPIVPHSRLSPLKMAERPRLRAAETRPGMREPDARAPPYAKYLSSQAMSSACVKRMWLPGKLSKLCLPARSAVLRPKASLVYHVDSFMGTTLRLEG